MFDELDGPMRGLFMMPGVSFVARGGGDRAGMELAVTFVDDVIEDLSDRFQCAPDALVIMGEIVDGLRRFFPEHDVSVKRIRQQEATYAT